MLPPDVTELLVRWNNGDKQALDELLPLVYAELRRVAGGYLKHERPDHSLQATAVVHDVYLRLVDQKQANWQNRAHFFGVAAQIMRRILVDHARTKHRAKRGGGTFRLALSQADIVAKESSVDLVGLDDALKKLASIDALKSQIVELRFFGGLTIEETAEALGVSHATVERGWTMARAWLRREMTTSQ